MYASTKSHLSLKVLESRARLFCNFQHMRNRNRNYCPVLVNSERSKFLELLFAIKSNISLKNCIIRVNS